MAILVYVDNSNVWIEGIHVSAVKNGHALDVYYALEGRKAQKALSKIESFRVYLNCI
jgi:hypothetical protein